MKFNLEKYRRNIEQERLIDKGWWPTLESDGTIRFYSDWRAIGSRRRTKSMTVEFDRNGKGPLVRMSASMTEETKAMFMARYAELIVLLCKFGVFD